MFTARPRSPSLLVIAAALTLAGCHTQISDAREAPTVMDATTGMSGIDEAVWMALTGEPRYHLITAREELEHHKPLEAAQDLKTVAGLVSLEATRARTVHVRQRLEGAAIELREASRQADEETLGLPELNEITGRTLLAVSEHHRELAGADFEAHRPASAGIHLAEAARQLEHAYVVTGETMDAVSHRALDGAVAAAERLEGDGTQAAALQGDSALSVLRDDATRLENALGARRR